MDDSLAQAALAKVALANLAKLALVAGCRRIPSPSKRVECPGKQVTLSQVALAKLADSRSWLVVRGLAAL